MTDSRTTSPERMENKTQTQPPEFKEVTATMTEAQILADSYSISKSISNIILKQYAREMKKKAAKMIIFVILSMIIYGCITIKVNINPKQYPVSVPDVKDSTDCNSRWLFQF